MPFTYWYIATPYSKYPAGHEAAFTAACRFTGELMKLDLPVFSPIAHSHPISVHAAMDNVDHDLWVRADQPMLDAASAMIVIQMEGWEISRGIQHEIRVFASMGKPIIYWDPATEFPYQRARDVMAALNPKAPFKRWASGAESPWKRWSEESER